MAGRGGRSTTLSLVVICAVAFVAGLDITITNVAVPAIGKDLNASTSDLQWIVDSYNIAVAGLLLLGGALGERASRKWVFLLGLTLFLIGTLAAGLSGAVGPLIAARVVMGIGAALLLTPALSLIAAIFPPDQRARAIAGWATAGALGVAVGPVAGGVLVDSLGWNWIFFVNVPILLVTLTLGIIVLPPGRGSSGARLDVVGALLSVTGFALLLGGLIEGPRFSWSPPILAAVGSGAIIVVIFIWWELRREHPLFDVRVLAERPVTAAALALFTTYIAFTGILFLVPQHLQDVEGQSVLVTGLAMVPLALVFWVVSRQAGTLAKHWGAPRALMGGMLAIIAGFAIMALTASSSGVVWVIIGTCISAAGWGITVPLGSVVIINGLPEAKTGSAAGTSMFSRFAGAAAGVALLGSTLSVVYGLLVGPALDSLGTKAPTGVDGSLQQTLTFARTLSGSEAQELQTAAVEAFTQASVGAYAVGMVAATLTLALCAWLLPWRTSQTATSGEAEARPS